MHYEKFADDTVKCIEDEIPFDVPDGWEWCRCRNIVDLFSGQDLEPQRYNSNGVGIPYITGASNLSDGHVIINRWTETPTTHATINDLLLTCKGSGVGKMAICDIEDAHIARQIMALRCTSAICLSYLQVLMSAFITEITFQANGIIPGIRREIVLETLFPLPPYNEQIQIGDRCSALTDLVLSVDMDQAEMLSLVGNIKAKILDLAIRGQLVPQNPDDEPASVLLERIRAEKEKLIKQGIIKQDKREFVIFRGEDNSYYLRTGDLVESLSDWGFDDLPDSWDVCCLGEVCDYGNCENVEVSAIEESAWILDLEDIEKDTGKILTRIKKAERESTSTKHRFHKGQVLYSKLRPYLNKVVLAGQDGYCTSEILPLEFNSIICPEFARYYLMSPTFLRYASRCSYGVKMPRLGTEDGKKAIVPVPPINEQAEIVDRIHSVFLYLDSITASLE